MPGYAATMVEQSALFFQRWAGGGVRDIRKDMIDLAIAVAAQVFFGANLIGSSAGLGAAVQELSFILFRKSMSAAVFPEWVPTPLNTRLKRARTPLLEMVAGLIAARRSDGGDRGDRGDLLSMLLLAVDEEGDGKGMSDKQARDEIITGFNAGHDTTAGTLSWFWNLMAEHEDVQDALAARAREVLGQRAPDFGDLAALQPIEILSACSSSTSSTSWNSGSRTITSRASAKPRRRLHARAPWPSRTSSGGAPIESRIERSDDQAVIFDLELHLIAPREAEEIQDGLVDHEAKDFGQNQLPFGPRPAGDVFRQILRPDPVFFPA